eukprot:7694806-Karenia_brevis.AAC.1
MDVYRSILPTTYNGTRSSEDDLVRATGAVVPKNLVRLQRFMLLIRLLRCESVIVLAVIAAAYGSHRSWLATIHVDLKWLASRCPKLEECSQYSLQEWLALIAAKPSFFKAHCHQVIFDYENNLKHAWVSTKAERELGIQHVCECGAVFQSKQQYALHAFKRHGT